MINKMLAKFFSNVSDVAELEGARIIFYFILLIQIANYPYYMSFTTLPQEFFNSDGLLQSYEIILFLRHHFSEVMMLLSVSLFFSMIGFMSQISKWLVFGLTLIIFNLPFAYRADFYLCTPNLFLCFIFALSRAGSAYSVDALIKKREVPSSDFEYYWPKRFSKIVFVTVFFTSAIIKLKNVGLDWVFSDNLKNLFLCSPFPRGDIVPEAIMNLKLNYKIGQFPNMVKVFAFITLATELLSPLALFSFTGSRLPVVLLMIMQILSIFLIFLNPFNSLAIYICWVSWGPMLKRAEQIIRLKPRSLA